MDFLQLRNRAAFLAKQAGWQDAMPGPDWVDLVNRGLTDFSWDSEFNREQVNVTTVANQPTYTIPTPYFKSITDLAYTPVGLVSNIIYPTTEIDERNYDALWYTRPAGTTMRYMVMAPNVIQLVPPSATSGDTMVVRGIRASPLMVADTDVPGQVSGSSSYTSFPDTWHEAISLRAAFLYCEQWAQDEALATIQEYRTQYQGMVEACRDYITQGRSPYVQRVVSRPFRRRVYLRLSGHQP
jgi:hypothetical protein